MNPGLVWLLRNSPRALWRNVRKRLRGWKGVLVGVSVFFFVLMLLVPQLIEAIRHPTDPAVKAAHAVVLGPVGLLLMTGLTLLTPAHRRGGLYFRPAEIGVLFPAPVSRRELLLYHVCSRGLVQLASAVWISLLIMRHAPTWYGCLCGAFLALVFLQMLGQAVAIGSAAAGKRLAGPIRWGVMAAALAALVAGGARALATWRVDRGLWEAVTALRGHPAVQVAVAPFVPFVHVFAARGPLDVLLWGSVSLAMVAALVFLVSRLDVAYEEAALSVSRDVGKKLARMRSGGGAFAALGPGKARFAVPVPPYLRGIGPLAWRQTIEITRNVKGIALSMVMVVMPALLVIGAISFTGDRGEASVQKIAAAVLPMILAFSVISTQNIGFDFRRDLDRIAFLRSLPVAPVAVAAGQLVPGSLLLALVQWVAMAAVAIAAGFVTPLLSVAALPLLFALSWCVIALDNLLFLFLPHRIDPQDAGFMGRVMLVMFMKMLALGLIAGICAAAGALGWFAFGSSIAGAFVGVVLVLLVFDVVLTWGVGALFARFDAGRDAPDPG